MKNNNLTIFKGTFLFLTWGTNLGPLTDNLGLSAERFSTVAPGIRRFYSNISDSNIPTLNPDKRKQWLLDTKLALLKKGFPVYFQDFGQIRNPKYPAITHSSFNEIPFFSSDLIGKGGIYMLKNNITKKFYVGQSGDLKKRFNTYLRIKRLQENPTAIHRALLKFSYNNFSLTILEFCDDRTSRLLKEKFYITVLNPQLNIRDDFKDFSIKIPFWKSSYSLVLPQKIITYLVRCLDPNIKDWHLIDFKVSEPRADNSYSFGLSLITPNKLIRANSKGWHDGLITSKAGFNEFTLNKKKVTANILLCYYKYLPKKSFIRFLPSHMRASALKNLDLKIKALNSKKK